MSTRKRTYAELTQHSSHPSSSQQTPSRPGHVPSTPHAIRANQQRSAAKQRSAARSNRKTILKNNELPRPDSARGILRRLAQLTAPLTRRRVVTPAGKENEVVDEEDDEEEEGQGLQKPGLTLPIDDTNIEDEDSELPTAPTPSVLPEDDYDATMTFKAIDFARDGDRRPASERIDRRVSHVSSRGGGGWDGDEEDDEDDADITADITAEIGRRAMSEGPPTERFPRGSFGSIRMSDFGTELEIPRNSHSRQGRQSERTKDFDNDDGFRMGSDDEIEVGADAETENLRRLQRSPSRLSENDLSTQTPAMEENEETFRLDMPDEQRGSALEQSKVQPHPFTKEQEPAEQGDDSGNDEAGGDDEPEVAQSPLFVPQSLSRNRKQTSIERAAVTSPTRPARKRKTLKLTRHGNSVPSLPSSLIKRIAIETQTRIGKRKPKLGREHMKALEQATEWFFEQVGEDLEAFSGHGRRKKRIDESDVLMLMRRQRVACGKGELSTLAQEWLTREVAGELDLPDKL